MGCNQSSGGAKGDGSKGAAKTDKTTDKAKAKDDNNEFQNVMKILERVPLLKRLPKDQVPLLASNMQTKTFQANQEVVKQGDKGEEFYIISSGEASVKVTDDSGIKEVAKLKTGDYFGENAVLREETRKATITAVGPLQTLVLSKQKFHEMGLMDKLVFANRKAVGAGTLPDTVAKTPTPKTQEDRVLITKALRNNENLSVMVRLDDDRVGALIDIAWKEEITAGTELITEGDLNADFFYVVAAGKFEVSVAGGGEEGQSADQASAASQVVKQLSPGNSFGELALLYLVPRAATVKAMENSTVWVIDRKNFKSILMKVSKEKIDLYVKYLNAVPTLNCLLDEERKALAKALVEMHFTKNEEILRQGEPGSTFYILYDGKVQVLQGDQVVNTLEGSASKNVSQQFGEKALLENDVRAATIKVISETAKALVLDRDTFDTLLGPLKDIMSKQTQTGRPSQTNARPSQMMKFAEQKPKSTIYRKDLQRVGLLGCGGFGCVELVEHKVSKDSYALKMLSKGYIVKTGMQDSVMNEKNILMMTNSTFVVKLFDTYNGQQSLYFLLEPALGGELYATYNRKGFHGSEKHAKYYIAGVVFAFEHLHERRIIYRDLKPENLLLTELGHIKLTDMGLAKFVIGKSYTTCGTPDYFAPELIASTGHTNAVDWWTLGVLVFELMAGHPPFESAYPMQIYSKVMKGINKVPFPTKCQGACGDLIKGLLKNEPSERLPMRPGGTKNVKDCKWFEGFDWDKCKNVLLTVPYKPIVNSRTDLANFSARKEDMPRQYEYTDPGTGWDKEFATSK